MACRAHCPFTQAPFPATAYNVNTPGFSEYRGTVKDTDDASGDVALASRKQSPPVLSTHRQKILKAAMMENCF